MALIVAIPLVALAQITPDNVATLLSMKLPDSRVSQGNFLRVLPALLGFGARIKFNAPIEEFVLLLTDLGIMEPGYPINPPAPVTRGWAAVLKVKALGIQPNLIEWIQIKISGLTPAIATKMAQRAGVMPPGKAENTETGMEFASECLAIASLARTRPLPGANISSILAIISAITSRVVNIKTCELVIPGLVHVPTS